MQRPRSMETEVKRDSGEARAAGGLREEEHRERQRRMRKAGACLFIREKVNRRAQKLRKTQMMIIQPNERLDSQKALKMKIRWEITSSKFFIFSKDDVMAGYKNLYEDKRMDFI